MLMIGSVAKTRLYIKCQFRLNVRFILFLYLLEFQITVELYRYFSMPYPLPKLDMVSVPEFSGGAMENYGLITYRETELLQDELHSAAANVIRVGNKSAYIFYQFLPRKI